MGTRGVAIDEAAKEHLIDHSLTMIAVGAKWDALITELFRKTLDRNFKLWKAADVPTQKTLNLWILKRMDASDMSEVREKSVDAVKCRLQSKALDLALQGNVSMMIFLLKNLCGYADRPEGEAPIDVNLSLKNIEELTDDELDREIRSIVRVVGTGENRETKKSGGGKGRKKKASKSK